MTQIPRILLVAALLAAVPVHPIGLPDTGQDLCYDDAEVTSATAAGDTGTHPRQDCRYGRDAAANAAVLTKTGAGPRGFDYSKIANNGTTLADGAILGAAATDWACTKDNITGLTWEVKTAANSADLRASTHHYSWYNSDGNSNGGDAGRSTGSGFDVCSTTVPGSPCNTEAFVAAVNAAALCSYTDWRMPTRRELRTLYYADPLDLGVSSSYFPNSTTGATWSGSTYAALPAYAWDLDTYLGTTGHFDKGGGRAVRLVRGGHF